MEHLRDQVNKVTSYPLSFDANNYVLVLFANIHQATLHEYGCNFCKTHRNLCQQYNYDHHHDDISFAVIVHMLTVADSIRDPSNAPALEPIHSVSKFNDLLYNFVNRMGTSGDYDKDALGVSSSNSESSCSTKKSAHRDHPTHSNLNRCSGQGCSKSWEGATLCWQDNPCKYCKKFKWYR